MPDLKAPPGVVVPGVASAQEAKERRLFWLYDPSGQGAAIRLLENEAVFREVFPGYGSAREDWELWDRYFRERFDINVYAPSLTPPASALAVGASWIGSSESYLGLVTGLLSRALVPGDPKILYCTTGSMIPKTVGLAADAMNRTGRRARVAVWGYGPWAAYEAPAVLDRQRPKWKLIERWESGATPDSFAARFLKPRQWGEAVKLDRHGLFSWRKRRGRVDAPMIARVGGVEMRKMPADLAWSFPRSLSSDEKALESVAALTAPFFYGMEGAAEWDCDTRQAAAKLDETLGKLLTLADRVVVFVPSVTPLHSDYGPA